MKHEHRQQKPANQRKGFELGCFVHCLRQQQKHKTLNLWLNKLKL